MKDKPVILVVDDNPQNIELLEAHLVPEGYEIVKAANGEEALGKLSGNQIDLMLLDVMMPGMDGFEVTRRVRQDNTHRLLPIILVAALTEREARVKGIEAGCDDFISKPVEKIEILARVRSLLKVRAYNDLMSNYRQELETEVTRRTEELKHAMENLQQEITQRKRSEESLRVSEERFRTYVERAPDGVFIVDDTGRYLEANKSASRIIGYSEEELEKMSLRDLLAEESLEEGVAHFNKLMETGAAESDLWHKHKNGSKRCLTVNAIKLSETRVLGFVKDITDRKQAEEQLKDTLESLRTALNTTIRVMVSAVEMRDPYTAGHQLRVANIARAIATEMGLPQEKIEGIRMAGSIHDIGKLSIPAEILSKPGKLSEIEFSMIKEHPRKGYEMLKDVASPWPLAQIVYQHHERMNGSGYPRNLKGDEILIEARILSVADVMEAMSSHRPYRPAIGIEGQQSRRLRRIEGRFMT